MLKVRSFIFYVYCGFISIIITKKFVPIVTNQPAQRNFARVPKFVAFCNVTPHKTGASVMPRRRGFQGKRFPAWLSPEIGDGQHKTEPDLHRPGEHVNQELHLGAVVFLQQNAIGVPQDIPGPDFFFGSHDRSLFGKI
jgi:hypothetical protein